MSFKIRHAISKQLINLLNISNKNIKLSSKFEINRRVKNGVHIIPELHLPVAHLIDGQSSGAGGGGAGDCWLSQTITESKSLQIADPMEYPAECHLNSIDFIRNKKNNTINKIIFQLKLNEFLSDTIEDGLEPIIIDRNLPDRNNNNVLIEFSSPNIAKPFHVGHLRSTIIGNFISNLYHFVRVIQTMEVDGEQQQQQQQQQQQPKKNYNVIRMNYLGDWGTQFGYLQIGLNEIGDAEMKLNPIKHLFTAYVHANRLAATNDQIPKMAKKIFYDLEMNQNDNNVNANANGANHQNSMDQWNVYRKYTITELTKIYERLGITFDEYLWESQYNRQSIEWCLDLMKHKGIIEKTTDGEQWIIKKKNDKDVDDVDVDDKEKLITIIKNDGTTLYLTRDIASLIERYHKYQFHKLYYIVDSSQHEHFKILFEIIKRLIDGDDGDSRIEERIQHIKFGRIKGMSTRKGNVIFLNDILDEAKLIMKQKQIESPTTKVNITNMEEDTADILGISAVIINDLKQRRTRDYDFDWDKALQTNGDTGIKLQYTHCRLCSLEETVIGNSCSSSSDSTIIDNATMPIVCKPELLMEFEAQNLIYEIGKFQEIIGKTEENLEACILVNYLFSLCNAISKALKQLNIKNHENVEVQQQRILLFHSARKVLYQGMLILGLKPLNKM